MQGTTAGAIVKRNGLSTFSSPADTLTSLFPLESTGSLFLIGAGGTSLYKVTTGGTASAIKTGLTSGKRWEFVSAPIVSGQGPLFGMNGTDTPQQWDGAAGSTSNWTNASGGVGVPNGKYCVYAGNQVFVAGTAANPSRVYWSAIADPTNWDAASLTGAGNMDFDPNDGQAISGLGRVGPYILVCKPRKLFILVDPASATMRRLSESVGCVAHRSIASGPNGTYLLAEDRGVYLTNGSKLTPISDKIQPTLDYDEKLQSWWKHSFGSNQFALWHPTGPGLLYSAKATSAVVDQCFAANVFQDNGSNFTWVWRGPWQSPTFYRRRRFPTPYFRKRLRQIRVMGSGTVDLSLAKGFAGSETLITPNILSYVAGSDNFGGTGDFGAADGSVYGGTFTINHGRQYSLGVSDAFSIVFSATSNTPDIINLYVYMMTDRRDGVT